MLGKGREKNTPKIVDKEENPVVKHRVHGENSVNFHQQTLFPLLIVGENSFEIIFSRVFQGSWESFWARFTSFQGVEII